MVQEHVVLFDAEQKVWTSPDHYADFVNRSLGAAFLKTMRSIDEHQVLEYYYDTGLERTAGQIYREAIAVAKNLQRLGIQKGDVITMYSTHNEKIAPLTFGCFLVGAVVNFLETKFCAEHIDYTLKLVEPTVIFIEEQCRADLYASLKRSPLPSLKYTISIDAAAAPNVNSELFRPVSTEEASHFQSVEIADPQVHPAVLMFTSGSSGIPKAVQLNHALLLRGLITWWREPTHRAQPDADNSVLLCVSPLRWIGQLENVCQSVILGLKRICTSKEPSGPYGREIMRECRVTHYFTAPGRYYDILAATEDGDDALSSLRIALLGGDPTSQLIYDLSKKLAPNCQIVQCYGMTELSGVISNHEKLVPGLKTIVLDDGMRPLGPNERGQLCHKAQMPIFGYLKRDNSSYFTEDGYFISGDYGYIDEQNNLKVLSRVKDLVCGKNVILIPNEVESLVNKMPEVSTSLLVGCKESGLGENEIGALFVVLENAKEENLENILKNIYNTLMEHLQPAETNVIKHIYFRDQLPLLSCGKVDRSSLKKEASLLW